MNPIDFLRTLEDTKLAAAIREAESRTSGEIRVWISRRPIGDALEAAQLRFQKLAMAKTRERNAVLLYFAPRTRSFAIVGDTGVHERCGQAFWEKLAAQLTHDIHEMPMTEAIEGAIRTVGDLLAVHFPVQSDDRDELPNTIGRD